jgi:hypothetical protein
VVITGMVIPDYGVQPTSAAMGCGRVVSMAHLSHGTGRVFAGRIFPQRPARARSRLLHPDRQRRLRAPRRRPGVLVR